MTEPRPFWHIDKHADRRPFLAARGWIKSALRAWFEAEGFTEVDTACLQVSPGNEAHLHAFATEFRSETGTRRPLYLHTSPEFAMKKLLAAGETRIFSFAPVFRNAERSTLHAPEFTMLEWYRVGAPYAALWADCQSILEIACNAAAKKSGNVAGVLAPTRPGTPAASTAGQPGRRGPVAQPEPAVPRLHHRSYDARLPAAGSAVAVLTMREAFVRFAGIDLFASIGARGVNRERLAAGVAAIGLRVAPDDSWSDLFSRVMVERIEPALARLGEPVMLSEWPTHEAALARPCDHDPRFAERFELYAAGVELANGFGELTDPAEQRRRFEAEMDEKARVYGERYPLDEDFLAALGGMPAASGCALGFDRLVMLATGASHIDQVQWTPM